MVDEEPIEVLVMQSGTLERARLRVTLTGRHINQQSQGIVTSALTRMLGLRIDLGEFYRLAAGDKRLGVLAEQFRGLKPPRFPDVFEGLVNAIACQQLSLTVGIELQNRLARRCGPALESDGSVEFGFPRSKELLLLKPEAFRELGFSYRKAKYLLGLSQETATGQFDFGQLEHLDNPAVTQMLLRLHGVGRWTAEYVCSGASVKPACFQATTLARVTGWLSGSDSDGHWITAAQDASSIVGSLTPVWCTFTFCWRA